MQPTFEEEACGACADACHPSLAAFVAGLGIYDRVVEYDAIASLNAAEPTVFVDMAGDAAVTRAVHEQFGDVLKYSCSLGGTHWQRLGFGVEVPGPKPTLFFAPDQLTKRIGEPRRGLPGQVQGKKKVSLGL